MALHTSTQPLAPGLKYRVISHHKGTRMEKILIASLVSLFAAAGAHAAAATDGSVTMNTDPAKPRRWSVRPRL